MALQMPIFNVTIFITLPHPHRLPLTLLCHSRTVKIEAPDCNLDWLKARSFIF
ncbi:MAG: hypothetical protein N4J56_007644 [Chroococcidiopsis sp. SAG 2025]|nr:hypothetical protein [Chroococcidiopsis sp. SAG 2025]